MAKKVMIFDDDKTILSIFSIVLESSGYIVEISETSHDIIERLEQAMPDVIIMDNWIPDIGGIEATKLVKSNARFKDIPVVYCSANSDIASLAAQAGAEAYLPKPFDLVDLEKTIEALM
ncbi:response regulator [Sphingobacterium yanglingense]|nr:response regulator [Sphingobacterium yanglingense]